MMMMQQELQQLVVQFKAQKKVGVQAGLGFRATNRQWGQVAVRAHLFTLVGPDHKNTSRRVPRHPVLCALIILPCTHLHCHP